MVKIPMRDHDQPEVAGLAAGAPEFIFQVGSLIRAPGVDQDKPFAGFDQVTIYQTETVR